MIYERIKQLCKQNKISVTELENSIGYSRGYLCKIDKHKPNHETFQKISDYFDVSIDYLMNGKENIFVESQAEIDYALAKQNERIKKYMLKFAELPEEKRNQIMSLIDMLEDK